VIWFELLPNLTIGVVDAEHVDALLKLKEWIWVLLIARSRSHNCWQYRAVTNGFLIS
jgi:hypothetical protein